MFRHSYVCLSVCFVSVFSQYYSATLQNKNCWQLNNNNLTNCFCLLDVYLFLCLFYRIRTNFWSNNPIGQKFTQNSFIIYNFASLCCKFFLRYFPVEPTFFTRLQRRTTARWNSNFFSQKKTRQRLLPPRNFHL